ncbi:MAG: 16S rRNA (uracil(1498)-N(3))-methyltransferase [Bryobacterales bacterium]|nr:16S rRNA (uracil(1498)-N(3))-methyltransferase [Bryobacterales bacterium]
MARRRFFVDAVVSGRARIEGPDAHHLTRVLRVEPGQQFEICDNQSVYLAEVESAHKDLVSFAVQEELATAEFSVRTTILASLIRFERFEWMLEKATELGIERVVPVDAERSEKGLELAALKRLPRWSRIVREASEQSRRARLPEIGAPVALAAALEMKFGHTFVLEETDATPMLRALPAHRRQGDSVALLVGPEGGWTDRERDSMANAGWCAVSLGPQILRAETAAVAALAIINAAWGAPAS